MQISRRTGLFLSVIVLIGLGFLVRAHLLHAKDLEGTGPALTIYNQQFAVVRQGMSLNLREGTNHIDLTDITGHLEPDSVILRSLDGGRQLKLLEQNYRNDPLSQQLLLSLYEGKTIDFVMPDKQIVKGQIIRSGFVPHSASAYSMYGQAYYQTQMAYAQRRRRTRYRSERPAAVHPARSADISCARGRHDPETDALLGVGYE